MRLPASIARRGNQITQTQGDGFATLLDLPSLDAYPPEGGWTGQRGHVLLRLPAEAAGRRTIEWRLTQSDRNGTAVTRGKIGSSNMGNLIEPTRQGGVILPVFGGFKLEVAPFTNAAAATMNPEAFYSPADSANGTAAWETTYQILLAPALGAGAPGAYVEIGPPPFGATRLQNRLSRTWSTMRAHRARWSSNGSSPTAPLQVWTSWQSRGGSASPPRGSTPAPGRGAPMGAPRLALDS